MLSATKTQQKLYPENPFLHSCRLICFVTTTREMTIPTFALTREALCKSFPQFQIVLLASATCHYKCIIAHIVTTTIA